MAEWRNIDAPDFTRAAELQSSATKPAMDALNTLSRAISDRENIDTKAATGAVNQFLELNIKDIGQHKDFDINGFLDQAQELGADRRRVLNKYNSLHTDLANKAYEYSKAEGSQVELETAQARGDASIAESKVAQQASLDILQDRVVEDEAFGAFYQLLGDSDLMLEDMPLALHGYALNKFGDDARAVSAFMQKAQKVMGDFDSIFSEQTKEDLSQSMRNLEDTYKYRGVPVIDSSTGRYYSSNGEAVLFTEDSLMSSQQRAKEQVARNDVLIYGVEKDQEQAGSLATIIKGELGTNAGSAITYIQQTARDPQTIALWQEQVRNHMRKMVTTVNGRSQSTYSLGEIEQFVASLKTIPESTQLAAYKSSATSYGLLEFSPIRKFKDGVVDKGLNKENYRTNLIDFQVRRTIAELSQKTDKEKLQNIERVVDHFNSQREKERKQVTRSLLDKYRAKYNDFTRNSRNG